MDKDYAPLSNACFRALNDKLYDKRKAAALEIEKMARDFNAVGNGVQIKKLLKILGQDFTLSNNPNSRKGGLIGLAAMAIALGKDSTPYIDDMIRPMLSCFTDQDSRVRYYACEALYNVVKVSRSDVLPLFKEVFDSLSKLSADPDQNVKSGAELLDRLLKDIVTESPSFDLVECIDLIRDRIHGINQFSRIFIVSWISLLDSVPDIDITVFLPKLLDGLFKILADPTPEIHRMTETVLAEILTKISQNPSKADFTAIINIVTIHSQSDEPLVKYTALTWLKEMLNLANRKDLLLFSASILTAILPSLTACSDQSDDSDDKTKTTTNINIREVAKVLNYSLMKLVTMQDIDGQDMSPTTVGQQVPNNGRNESTNVSTTDDSLDLSGVLEVLVRELRSGENASTLSKLAVLRWVLHLYSKVPQKIVTHLEAELLPVLLKTLSDKSDEVVLMDLKVLAQIFVSSSSLTLSSGSDIRLSESDCYFTKFMSELLKLFHTNGSVLEERGSFIIRQLCLLMTAEDVYRSLSEILLKCEEEFGLQFCCSIVQTLNTILLTASELFELRNQLKYLKTDESCSLFCCLYRTWCHSPVATVSLCYLTKNYKHACDLLLLFGELNLTVEFLTEVDQMVQLLESPIFAYLRLEMLDIENNCDLIKSLNALLMLLPQSQAFHLLRKRLQCVPNFNYSSPSRSHRNSVSKVSPTQPHMDFKELLRHFHSVQQKHQSWSRRAETWDGISDRMYNI